MDEHQSELECRVCRMGEEDSRPLYTPCQCSGSIGLVHQDCLEAWLSHSKKDSCELCNAKYQFEALYSNDMPDTIPLYMMIKALLRLAVEKWVPLAFKSVLAIAIWLVTIPIVTVFVYLFGVGRSGAFLVPFTVKNVIFSLTYGIVIDITLVISMLVLLSFTDFVRAHGRLNGEAPEAPAPRRVPRRQAFGNRHRPRRAGHAIRQAGAPNPLADEHQHQLDQDQIEQH